MIKDSNSICISGLDPALSQLAEMLGLLAIDSQDPNTQCINSSWFEDPISQSSEGIKNNPAAFAKLLATLLGEVAGNALGIPAENPGLLGNWHPIPNPSNKEATGLYLVTTQDSSEPSHYIFSLGLMHTWPMPSASPEIDISAYALVPLIKLGGGSLTALLGVKGYPITVGLTGTGTKAKEGTPLVKAGGFSFNGAKFSAALDVGNSADPLQLSVVVLSLQLPGEKEPSDRSLADLAAIGGEQIIQTASSLFVTALNEILGQQQEGPIQYLLPILGLSSTFPGSENFPSLPILRWDTLISSAIANDIGAPFRDWFRELAADPDLLKAWLTAIAGFAGNSTLTVSGSGSRTDPLRIPIITIADIGTLSFKAATSVNDNGDRTFFPGLSFEAKPYEFNSSITLTLAADLELAAFVLSTSAASFDPSSLHFTVGFSLINTEGPLVSYEEYACETLTGSLALASAGGSLKVVPSFKLTGVKIPGNSLGTVELLSPSSFSDASAAVLSAAITSSLQKLFNLTTQNTGSVASESTATLLGVVPPVSSGWPDDLAPPLSASQLKDTLSNPISALANYYANIANSSATVNGEAPFTFILKAMTSLLTVATDSQVITVTGSGTFLDPWAASLHTGTATLPATLLIWKTPDSGTVQTLSLALSLAPKITVAGLNVVPSVDIQLLDLVFAGSNVSGVWLPKATLQLSLPDSYESPSIADVKFTLSNAKLSAGWERSNGWAWSFTAGAPTLTIGDGQAMKLGQDINFSDKNSLNDLVTTAAATFAPIFTGLMGAALVKTDTRPGLALTALLGLLPDVSTAPNYPAGLTWPTITPLVLSTLFTDPRQELRNRISAIFVDQNTASEALSMLSWAFSPTLDNAPTIAGSMAFEKPMPLPIGSSGFDLLLWYIGSSASSLGLGLGRSDKLSYGNNIEVTITSRINAITIALQTGKIVSDVQTPSASVVTHIANPNGPLISLGDGSQLGAVELGFTITFIDEEISLTPVVTLLDVQIAGAKLQNQITLAEFRTYSADLQQTFLTLLNLAVAELAAAAEANDGFQTVYTLLQALGLVVPRPEKTSPYGINPGGWNGLLADPTSYAKNQLLTLLANTELRNDLYDLAKRVLGISVPTPPPPVLALMQAFDLIGTKDKGYPILPQALLELIHAPFETLKARANTLVISPDKLATLVAAIVGETDIEFPQDKPWFKMSLVQGTSIKVSTITDVFVLGNILGISGSINFNIANLTLDAEIDLTLKPIAVTLQSSLNVGFAANAATTSFSANLLWGNRNVPSAIPLTIFPFDSNTFIKQATDLAPVYALDVLTAAVLESELIDKYPLPRIILQGLGMVEESTAGTWVVPSLAGLLRDPLAWLLSDEVLGDNGQFNLSAFSKILQRLTTAQPNGWNTSSGIMVKPSNTELTISGLPYHVELSFTASKTQLQLTAITGGFPIAGSTATLKTLSAGITLNADYQPGFVGSVELGASTNNGWYINTGISDNVFSLSVGQGSLESPTGLQLDILPFLGWGSFAEQVAKLLAPLVLQQVLPKIISGLEANKSTKDFAIKLSQIGTDLNLTALTNQLAAVKPFTAENIEDEALHWLMDRFNSDNRDATANALVTLFSGIPTLATSLSQDAGLVKYRPSAKIPITIEMGVNTDNNLGLWVLLDLPEDIPIKISIAPTGVSIPLQGTPTPVFSFGVVMTVPVDNSVGPQLGLTFDSSTLLMGLDPLGDSANINTHSSLYREIFPEFFPHENGQSPTLSTRLQSWVVDVVTQVLPRYISVVLLNKTSVKTWLNNPIFSGSNSPDPATILTDTQIITVTGEKPNQVYALSSLDTLLSITIPAFLGNLIKSVLKTQITVLTFNDGKGSITVGPSPTNDNAFGVRLAIADMTIEKLPYIIFQLGASNNEWIKNAGGNLGKLSDAPGLSVYIPVVGNGAEIRPDFNSVELNLINVGLDFVGKKELPLVSFARFQLGSIAPRSVLSMNLGNDFSVDAYGGMVSLNDMMMSLSPNTLSSAGGGNPIAQNLLGSGTNNSQPPVNNPPANPSFSLSAAYIQDQNQDGGLYVQLVGSEAGDNAVIVPVQRSFGPLYIGSVGLGWKQSDYLLNVLFTGSVTLAGLKAELSGLTVGIPVKTLTDLSAYTLDLQGLDVSFQGGSVSISGGLLKTTTPDLMYTGTALIKASTFSIMAAGSYAELTTGANPATTSPSLFIFGALNTPLGGPPSFFVTGLAAGFGYNRSLTLPSVGEVQNFPLVAGVKNGSFSEGQAAESALEELNSVIAPAVGEYWLAAGVSFTTYKLLDTLALLFIKFGREFEINLIGLSTASLPPQIPKSEALAYIELAIKVTINPSVGFFSAEAQLTPNSYVITKDCKLTGGFAFYLWFKDQTSADGTAIYAGDFVISLGGYHPAFVIPSYYPTVPRLGFKWLLLVGDVGKVDISGGAYFALVPTAIMAGGMLNVVFTMGPISAWLMAQADFLIEWQPFFFQVDILVSIGASFHTTIAGVSITISAELGAKLSLTGPPTHGHADVNWYVISFTIPIGDSTNATTDSNLDWDRFSTQLLQPKDSNDVQQVLKLAIREGLLDGPGAADQTINTPWQIRAVPFSLGISSAIPISQLSITGFDDVQGNTEIGVRPMGKTSQLDAPLVIQIIDSKAESINLKERNITVTPTLSSAPAALWSRLALVPGVAPNSATMVISNALMGVNIDAIEYVRIGTLKPFPITNLSYDLANGILPYYLTPDYPPSEAYSTQEQALALSTLQKTIMLSSVIASRNDILTALRKIGISAPTGPNLSVMASSANNVLQAPPVLARIGLYQTGAVAPRTAFVTSPVALKSQSSSNMVEPKLLSIRRCYCHSTHNGQASQRDIRHSWIDSHTKRQSQFLQPTKSVASSSPDSSHQSLFDGTLMVWRIARQSAHQIDFNGSLGLRLTSLDQYGDIIADQLIHSPSTQQIPSGAETLAIEGINNTGNNDIAGWDINSVLSKLSANILLGHRVIVQTQNSSRLRKRGRLLHTGLVHANNLLKQNQVQSSGGKLIPGWVKTLFSSPIQCFAVTISTSAVDPASQILVTVSQGTQVNDLKLQTMTAASTIVKGSDIMIIFSLDKSTSYTNVVVRPRSSSTSVVGVIACNMTSPTLATKLVEHQLTAAALNPHATAINQSQIALKRLASH
ncbi:diguanylate cyclase/phosphodiesterase (GGDEF & EAL domains) with PAS/PAC sensor(s) [hydrothermal vent metagenome]|uniref:Diguanylate cyclase/phosphodiesterase (GGDEF & EAL domains) with PAS/PAC sensor(S) n=1 Tax=hydrothermal vent metagenome TaxID=652676 RepID=A0A3B0YCK5_9ZZZZ